MQNTLLKTWDVTMAQKSKETPLNPTLYNQTK
jgi:hypothetical protein